MCRLTCDVKQWKGQDLGDVRILLGGGHFNILQMSYSVATTPTFMSHITLTLSLRILQTFSSVPTNTDLYKKTNANLNHFNSDQ